MFIVEPFWILHMADLKQQVTRLVLGQGGRLFPSLAGRAAFALFCRTENPAKPNAKEKAAIDRAAPLMAEARKHRLKLSSGCVTAHQFRAKGVSRGRVLVIHGWRSRTDFMANMIVSMVTAGFDVVGLDLPGHGQSTGRQLNIKLGVEAVTQASQWLGPFDLVVGHSFGGAVAVNAAVGGIKGHAPVPFGRVAVIASPNSMPELFTGVGRYFGLRIAAQSAMENRIEDVAGYPLATFVLSEQMKRFDGEVLVLHAPDDREVSYEGALAMAKAGDHVTHIAFEGLGHRRIIADEKVFAALREFAGQQGFAKAA
jgi:pimeloyl-ACP methyl ester carboxylesterase